MSCERRPLEEEVGNIAKIPYNIDWSQSGLNVSAMNRATIRVFPHDGSPAYDFRLQGDDQKESGELILPIGKYSFIIINETTDSEQDRQSLIFKELDDYDKFMVTTSDDPFRGLFARGDEVIVKKTPAALASWSIDEFEVTREMIIYSRSRAKGSSTKALFSSSAEQKLDKELKKLTTITPLSTVKTLNIVAHVQNLTSAKKASGSVNGATQGILLSTRKPITGVVTHIFILNDRKPDLDAPQNGTIRASILVFNVENSESLKYELAIDFLLHDGVSHPTEVFDITRAIKKEEINININVGFNNPDDPDAPDDPESPDDRPIVLPEVSVGGNVDVDNWDNIIVPIG